MIFNFKNYPVLGKPCLYFILNSQKIVNFDEINKINQDKLFRVLNTTFHRFDDFGNWVDVEYEIDIIPEVKYVYFVIPNNRECGDQYESWNEITEAFGLCEYYENVTKMIIRRECPSLAERLDQQMMLSA